MIDSDLEVGSSQFSESDFDVEDDLPDEYPGDTMDTVQYEYIFGENGLFYDCFPAFRIVDPDEEENAPDLAELLGKHALIDDCVPVPKKKKEKPTEEVPPAPTPPPVVQSSGVSRKWFLNNLLDHHRDDCIAIPVEDTCARSDLLKRHEDLACPGSVDGKVDFKVLYDNKVSTGWAVPITAHEESLAALKALYPEYRSLTDEDVFLLRNPNRSLRSMTAGTEEKKAEAPQPAIMMQPKPTTAAARIMNSKDHFLRALSEAGGWEKAVFVAMDMEAATLAPGGIAYPLELCLIPFTLGSHPEFTKLPEDEETDDIKNEFHTFVHPGYIKPELSETAKFNSLSIHGIPVGGSFLRTDYALMRDVLELFLADKSCIFISKGGATSPTVADAQAIRFIYAAAGWDLDEENVSVPSIGALRIFNDFVVTQAAAEAAGEPEVVAESVSSENSTYDSQDEHIELISSPSTSDCSKQCWYHYRFQEIAGTLFHCARQDAWTLAKRIQTEVQKAVEFTSKQPTD